MAKRGSGRGAQGRPPNVSALRLGTRTMGSGRITVAPSPAGGSSRGSGSAAAGATARHASASAARAAAATAPRRANSATGRPPGAPSTKDTSSGGTVTRRTAAGTARWGTFGTNARATVRKKQTTAATTTSDSTATPLTLTCTGLHPAPATGGRAATAATVATTSPAHAARPATAAPAAAPSAVATTSSPGASSQSPFEERMVNAVPGRARAVSKRASARLRGGEGEGVGDPFPPSRRPRLTIGGAIGTPGLLDAGWRPFCGHHGRARPRRGAPRRRRQPHEAAAGVDSVRDKRAAAPRLDGHRRSRRERGEPRVGRARRRAPRRERG